jgi:hypothetical protein
MAAALLREHGPAFARQLLVTGLPQGPFLVATTVRGSPNGGNRAEHVTNCNTGDGNTGDGRDVSLW